MVNLDGRLILRLFPPFRLGQQVSERATLRLLDGTLWVPTPGIVAQGGRDGCSHPIMMRPSGVLGSEASPTLDEAEKNRFTG